MKKLFLLLILLPTLGLAQARLGYSISEIYDEFKMMSPSIEVNDDNITYMVIPFEQCLVLHYFDDSKECFMSIIAPQTQGNLNFYVEYYNSRYVVLSNKSWRMYSQNGNSCDIDLITNDENSFFVWK